MLAILAMAKGSLASGSPGEQGRAHNAAVAGDLDHLITVADHGSELMKK